MIFRAVVAVLLISATVEAGGGVSFWKEKVTLTCPEEGTFYKIEKSDSEVENKYPDTYEYTFTKGKDLYKCKYGDGTEKTKYFFYVDGKACQNCIELNALVFAGVIVADVIGTVIVMVIIYKCTKNRAPAAPKNAKNSAARSRQQETPSNSDYQSLSAHTRSHDTYATAIKRTG